MKIHDFPLQVQSSVQRFIVRQELINIKGDELFKAENVPRGDCKTASSDGAPHRADDRSQFWRHGCGGRLSALLFVCVHPAICLYVSLYAL